jgi:3-hydroxybutyryl-CoA dehydrogenase
MGPLTTADLTGIDIVLHVTEVLHGAFGERFLPDPLLKTKVAAGEIGRKAGKGFYDYSK